MNIATFVSDSILALGTGYAAWRCYRAGSLSHWTIAAGLALVGLAAALGAVRYLGVSDLAKIHSLLSSAAAQIGNGLVATGLVLLALQKRLLILVIAVAVVLLLLFLGGRAGLPPVLGLSVGLASIAGMLFAGFWMLKRAGNNALLILFGATLIPIAGLLIGTRGHIFHIHRSDLFHYMLTVAFLLIGIGASRIPGNGNKETTD